MKVFRSTCRRRVLIAAFLPYLLLSVFVDFVHLHPLLTGTVPQISAARHVAACTGQPCRRGDSPCAICQWLRAGTGLQASFAVGPSIVLLAQSVSLPVMQARGSPASLSIDLRGPPSALIA
ncbi:MAG TPA: hypothetical protein VL484_20375 [Vicinamibacterales bacterium]|jgi:hypothetical protein|nr:hypothetical protein [Vicinamibacterales bacterium]